MRIRVVTALIAAAAALALTACSGDDASPEQAGSAGGTGQHLVVGSQDYYSNEILAEIYAQALDAAGYSVERRLRIGQRETYLPQIEAGGIDLFPEYTGPLLAYWQPATTARLPDDVYRALQAATPAGLRVLDQSPATDADAYVVSHDFAQTWHLSTIADLANVTVPLTMGANPEAEGRPNGPTGLKQVYGIDVGFTPIDDSGGPLTVQALTDGTVQLALMYSADPYLISSDLVVLEDPKGLILPSHVVPLASDRVDDRAAAVIDKVSADMGPADLIVLNARSVDDHVPAATIAADWLRENSVG